jgi:hypothetical protein
MQSCSGIAGAGLSITFQRLATRLKATVAT